MKGFLVCVVFLAGQMGTLSTPQDKPVVRLPPNDSSIPNHNGGDLLQLRNAPPNIELPQRAPTVDSHGRPWLIDVKNFGAWRCHRGWQTSV
jgi:hypothetical protein